MPFLNENYEQPATGGNYLKLKTGTTKFRILSDAVTGYQDRDKSNGKSKPVITKDKRPAIGEDQPKHFWAFIVWNYDDQKLQTAMITQKGIQNKIMTLYKDEDWGDPKDYDLKINKEGEKMETKYEVTTGQKTPVSDEIMVLYKKTKPNLDVLFVGGDPLDPQDNVDDGTDEMPW